MFDDFMVRAALAGIGVAFASAPLGCFVVWRRMAYFGDATAHAAILGVALSLAFSMSMFVGTVVVALLMALVVSVLSGKGYAMDTLLGVLAHSALAFGLVAVSFLSGIRIDLMAYLFGDILAVSRGDLSVIWGGAVTCCRTDRLALVSPANLDVKRGSGLRERNQPKTRATGANDCTGNYGCGCNQSGRCPAYCCHVDYSSSRSTSFVPDT